MRITVKTRPDYDFDDVDGSIETTIETDEHTFTLEFGQGEPEDMTLGRDLRDAYHIKDALIEAYRAGQRGELLKVVEESEDAK